MEFSGTCNLTLYYIIVFHFVETHMPGQRKVRIDLHIKFENKSFLPGSSPLQTETVCVCLCVFVCRLVQQIIDRPDFK